jgi:murein DD-endopeptidase MepM/ murein hydrolase activator NlpD
MEIARKKAEEEARKRQEEERRKQEEAKRAYLTIQQGNKAPASGTPNSNGNNTISKPSNINQGIQKQPAGNNSATITSQPPARSVVPKNYDYSLTPEANALSNSFENNRGRLPWPVEKGFISQGFGRYKHAIAEKVEMENYGIDISTSHNATARAVFEGTVVKIMYIDGKDWTVLVSHGTYFTVYSMLSKTLVQKDQHVSTKQSIGIVNMNDDGESIMNFQIWKSGVKLNPEAWIAR